MLRENFEAALQCAYAQQTGRSIYDAVPADARDSAFAAGLRSVHEASQQGEHIEVEEAP